MCASSRDAYTFSTNKQFLLIDDVSVVLFFRVTHTEPIDFDYANQKS